MKKAIIILLLLVSAFAVKAQSDTSKMHHYRDSLAKYSGIFNYYKNYAPQPDSVMLSLQDVYLKYYGKIDSMRSVFSHSKDSLNRIKVRTYLNAKYHIQLN